MPLLRIYTWFVQRIGRNLARLTLLPVTLYFFIVRVPERRASREFLNRALGRSATLLDIWRNFWTFSLSTLDRVYLLSDDKPRLDVTEKDVERLGEALDRGQGCILVGSHLGSFEAARVISRQRPDVNLRIVMDRRISPNANTLLTILNPKMAEQVIQPSEHRGTLALLIGEALQSGDLVAVLGDRIVEPERFVLVDFLGSKAAFPIAPFMLSIATRAPIILFFGLFEGGQHYHVVFEPFEFEVPPRGHRTPDWIDDIVQAYADRLAHHARRSPYNWFNFYPFWPEHQS